MMFPPGTGASNLLTEVSRFFDPNFTSWKGVVGVFVYAGMIFAFTYFWNAMMYNVEDIADNLKKGGSYIPGVRPGKQTTKFLNEVVSRVTFVGALFLAIAALTQYLFPLVINVQSLAMLGGTSLLIMVSVALETMRQIEANLLVKQYEG
jgi:preprotein translocase subunit SecY